MRTWRHRDASVVPWLGRVPRTPLATWVRRVFLASLVTWANRSFDAVRTSPARDQLAIAGSWLVLRPGRPRATVMLVFALLAVATVGGVWQQTVDVDAPAGPWSDFAEAPSASGSIPPALAESEAADADDLPADTMLVWSGFRLADGYADAVADDPRTGPVTVVRGGVRQLVSTRDAEGDVVDDLPDGWSYAVEVLAVDPATYDEVVGRPLLGFLDDDEAVLSETSAEVRGLGPGARLTFRDGTTLRVAEVLPDVLVGAGEVIVPVSSPLAVTTEKYLLARPGDGTPLEESLLDQGTFDREPRLVPHGYTPTLRHAYSVHTPAERKDKFGEFAMRDLPGRDIIAGQSWVDEHIVVASVPVLGRVTCHRELIEPLRAAMQELVDRGAQNAINDYAGCWVPRTSGSDGPLSSHAWGVSIDFNARANPYGAEPDQPDVLVEVMTDHGFIWGGDWHVPDAMHFELAPERHPGD